jgi:hypothetical protein
MAAGVSLPVSRVDLGTGHLAEEGLAMGVDAMRLEDEDIETVWPHEIHAQGGATVSDGDPGDDGDAGDSSDSSDPGSGDSDSDTSDSGDDSDSTDR